MRKSWIEVDYLSYLRYRASVAYGNEAQQAVRFAECLDPEGWKGIPAEALPALLVTAKEWGHPAPTPFDVHDGLTWGLPIEDLPVYKWRNAMMLWGQYNPKTLMHIPPVLAVLAEGETPLQEALKRVCAMPAPCGVWLEQAFDFFKGLPEQFPSIFEEGEGGNSHPAVRDFGDKHGGAEQLTWLVADDDVQKLETYVLKMGTLAFLTAASLKVDKLRMQNALAAAPNGVS